MKRAMSKWFRKTRCDKVHKMLSAYIDKQLDSREQQMVEAHLKTCQACRAEHDSLQQTTKLLRHVPLVSPTRPFIICQTKPLVRDGIFNALRITTVVAAFLLTIVLVGDMMGAFHKRPPPAPPGWQLMEERYTWPVRETEYALLGMTAVLAGVTFIYWRKRKREKLEKFSRR